MSSSGSDDEYYYNGNAYPSTHHAPLEKRYPIHDACEFDDIEALKALILERVPDEDVDYHHRTHHHHRREGRGKHDDDDHDEDDSSSDENDSTAAAHAAATGLSPLPVGKLATVEASALTNLTGEKLKQEADSAVESSKPPASQASGAHPPAMETPPPVAETTPPNSQNHSTRTADNPATPRTSNATPISADEAAAAATSSDSNVASASSDSNVAAAPSIPMDIDATKDETKEKLMPSSANADENKNNKVGSASEPNNLSPTRQEGENNGKDKEERKSPLSPKAAASRVGPPAVRYRVPAGMSLNEKDEDENTALHIAIHARKLEHVKLLLEMGASFRLKCDGSFAIHTAISMGSMRRYQQFAYECTVALHDAGADLTLKDDSNHTPLYLACMFNLPQIVSYILLDEQGLSTLNMRADRAGNRPLHAAAKFDSLSNPSLGKHNTLVAAHNHSNSSNGASNNSINHQSADASPSSSRPAGVARPQQQPSEGSVVTLKQIPGFPGKKMATTSRDSSVTNPSASALLTQVLLGIPGIEVDAVNSMGQTALHVACCRGNWSVVRLLLQADSDPRLADRRGFTPGQLAYKRGMPIPADLVLTLGNPPESGVVPAPRDLIVDPDGSTAILTDELCILHRTCPPIRRDSPEPPPENVRRLQVLVDPETGILRSGEFSACSWRKETRRAAMADVLKVHEYNYVETISHMASVIPDHPGAIAHLDPDTTVSRWSFEAALRAAGGVCQAVDLVLSGEHRNAFCAIRPPGHHAGPRGIVKCANDPDGGSHGFCLLNNVAIGAAYARSMYRNEGIRKVAIIDFDVHHGNGTEEIIRQLVPVSEKVPVRTPFVVGELTTRNYRPWLDETDLANVFFASTHGYGNRGFEQPGWFYPASGKSHTSEAISNPSMVENPNLTDFLFSQTWTRMGEESKYNCCKIINVGLDLPEMSSDMQGRSMKQRLELRDTYRTKILPYLLEFDPDLIFISAGFDAHRRDSMNFGYVGMVEDDYEWLTEQLVKVANTCCSGRIVSVLEGGYKIHGGIVSPFARSVASHVRALVDGSKSRELLDTKDMEWEAQYERHIYEKRERKKEDDKEKLRLRMEAIRNSSILEQQMMSDDAPPEDPDAPPSRKRRRNQVDYKELYKQLQQEGFAS